MIENKLPIYKYSGHLFVKWVSSTIASKSLESGEIDMSTIETLISEVCTHLIAAGVLKQIVDCGEATKDVFCVRFLFIWKVIIQREFKLFCTVSAAPSNVPVDAYGTKSTSVKWTKE